MTKTFFKQRKKRKKSLPLLSVDLEYEQILNLHVPSSHLHYRSVAGKVQRMH